MSSTELKFTEQRPEQRPIAAASGKSWAVLTAFAFGTISQKIGSRGSLGLFSGIMALAALITLLIPETKGKSLDDIENEILYGAVVEKPSSQTPTDVDSTEKGVPTCIVVAGACKSICNY